MKKFGLWCIVACFVGFAFAQSAEEPKKPGPEMQALTKDYVGQWKYESKVHASPMGPAASIKGTMDVKPILDGFVLDTTYNEYNVKTQSPEKARELSWYDSNTKKYHFQHLRSTGDCENAPFSLKNNAYHWKLTLTGKDKQKYRCKGTDTFKNDGKTLVRETLILVDGKWSPFYKGTFTKTKNKKADISINTKVKENISKPSAAHKKMHILLGTWTYEGHIDSRWKDTPFGPAGKFSGKFTNRLVLNGFNMLETSEETFESGESNSGTILFEYDEKNKCYKGHCFNANGTNMEGIYSFAKDTMKADFEQTDSDGNKSLIKAVWNFNREHDAFTSEWKLSLDEGKTWKTWAKYKGKKVADQETKAAQQDNTERNKAIIIRAFDEVFNAGNLDAIDEIYHKDFIRHDPDGSVSTGVKQHKNMVAKIRKTLPDYHENLQSMIMEENHIACRWTSTWTDRKSGKRLTRPCLSTFRFQDGKIIEQWLFFGSQKK